jgi:PPOX class probable F420-dependent enzyme
MSIEERACRTYSSVADDTCGSMVTVLLRSHLCRCLPETPVARRKKAMMIPESIRELVATGPLAHLTTLNADGSPQVSVVWVGIEDGALVCAHMHEHQKVKNIRRDGRVALSLLGHHRDELGLQEYLVVYGQASITEGRAAVLLQQLAHIYLGPDQPFPPESVQHLPGYITHIRPERFAGNGPWARGGTETVTEPKTE